MSFWNRHDIDHSFRECALTSNAERMTRGQRDVVAALQWKHHCRVKMALAPGDSCLQDAQEWEKGSTEEAGLQSTDAPGSASPACAFVSPEDYAKSTLLLHLIIGKK